MRRLDAVILSHAHIDHSGYLPRLVKTGFAGPVYCTRGTAELLRVMLPDAAHLQEEEAAFANRQRTSRHDPALPLFTTEDAAKSLRRLRAIEFGAEFVPAPGVAGALHARRAISSGRGWSNAGSAGAWWSSRVISAATTCPSWWIRSRWRRPTRS